jgi:abortive infection bacteriophage resistance protein
VKYTKPAISIENQILQLRERGLGISDDEYATKCLSSISYYRLRAYTYPFQDNTTPEHPFIAKISLPEIIEIYDFDSKLRQLTFKSLEKIEIALRTQIIYQFSLVHGSHWQLIPSLFQDTARFASHLEMLNKELKRSDETFIKHYYSKYTQPTQPPSWMSLEIASFGLLSKLFRNLKKGDAKNEVIQYFGLKKFYELENWMLCFTNLRNICAHHGRLYNRRFTAKPKLPYNTVNPLFSKIQTREVFANKFYAVMCCLIYTCLQIDSESFIADDFKELLQNAPLTITEDMGIPDEWETHDIWNR